MAHTNRKFADSELVSAGRFATYPRFSSELAAYPELQPVTPHPARTAAPLRSSHRKRATRGEFLFYIGVNVALVFGLVQCARSFIGDSLNLSRLLRSQASVQDFYAQTRQENRMLTHKIRLYSSPSGIEELARNYLNMVGENELPVRFQ